MSIDLFPFFICLLTFVFAIKSLKIYSLPDFIDYLKECDENRTIFQCYRKAEQTAFECQHAIYMDIKYRKCKFQKDIQLAVETWWDVKAQWQRNMSLCLNDDVTVEPNKKPEYKAARIFNFEFQDCLQEGRGSIKTCHQLSLKCEKFKLCWERADVKAVGQQADDLYLLKKSLLDNCINNAKKHKS